MKKLSTNGAAKADTVNKGSVVDIADEDTPDQILLQRKPPAVDVLQKREEVLLGDGKGIGRFQSNAQNGSSFSRSR